MLDLDDLEALEQAATPGKWEEHYGFVFARVRERNEYCVVECGDPMDDDEANAAFIAAIRNAAPDLITAARERDELRAWKANAEITLAEDLSHIRKLEGMIAELRIRIFKAQALAHKPGAHKEHVLAALDPDA